MIWKTFFWQPIRLRQLQRKICVNISNLVTGNLYVYDNCNAERKIQFSVSCTLATYTSTPIATQIPLYFLAKSLLATYTSTPIATCQTIQLSDAMFLATYTSTPIATNTCYYYDTLNNTGNLYVYANCNFNRLCSYLYTALATYTSTPIATCCNNYAESSLRTGNLYVYANCNRMELPLLVYSIHWQPIRLRQLQLQKYPTVFSILPTFE